MNQNAALRDISLEQGCPEIDFEDPFLDLFSSNVPDGSHHWWMDKDMIKLVVQPIFGNASIINEDSFEKAYLYLNGDSKRNFKEKNMLSIVDEATDDALKTLMAQAVEAKYKKAWWQYYTSLLTGFDIIYRIHHDPDYEPSAGEISLEALSAVLTLISIGFPVGQLTAASAKILRASLVKNLAKGLRGPALFLAVWAEVGSSLAFFPLRVLAIAGYEIFAFWEPLPLDTLTKSLYKQVRKFKFDFKFKEVKSKTIPNPEIKILNPEAPNVAKSGKSEPAEARGLLASLHQNDFRYYEYSYSYAKETPLGTGKLPDVDAAAPSAPKQAIPPADPRALNDEGAIELSSSRAITRVETPFRYSRSDATIFPEAVSSLGSEGRHLNFELMDQGIARNIEFHRRPFMPFRFDGELGIAPNTEVVHLRETADSVVGIRIDLEDIASDRPILITSGDMPAGTFLACVDEEDACVYFYRLGAISNNAVDSTSDNVAIRQLFSVHNALATRAEIKISVPDLVQKTDLLWFSKKFDRTMLIYADDPRVSDFTVLDQDFDFSTQPGAKPVTSHSASSSALDLLKYNRVSSDTNIIQSSGNAYYLLSRTDEDHVSIVGRGQYRGDVDTSQLKPWQPDADDRTSPEIATSDITEIVDLLVKSRSKVSSYIRVPDGDSLEAVEAAGKYFTANGYNVIYRMTILWPSKESTNVVQHYVPIVEKNGRAYLVDVTAGRFSSQGVDHPLCLTDSSWRIQYISLFPDHVVLIRDFNNFESLVNLVKSDLVNQPLAPLISNPDWTILNKPTWTLLQASEFTEAINIDMVIDINRSRTQRAYLDSPPIETLPSLPAKRSEKWNKIINDKGISATLTGSSDIAIKKFQAFLYEKNIKSKIIMTKTYENLHDENPVTNYVIQAELPGETADVIKLMPSHSGEAFTVNGVMPLKRWESENRHKITFFRLIDDPRTIPERSRTILTPAMFHTKSANPSFSTRSPIDTV
ncbi:hypothetical protein HHL24_28425 [Paraburkholderia sp. RP-4-7]|uniref:Dermonecrotic toxin n=1 Tax=Paraburkholderia polaris TaxID=2728848 RepID=A0A848INS8_9BURK|nr:cytotoxic necrotizing factor Rho-activating domain-containing protein [Paraburkholderia polaris]NMM01849.1 hypothetical protein [Paraburkholderia polaris]